MSNPYSSQSISGYNASPPADDGSQTTANQITWAKHKTKLADPIKTLSEGIDSAVSTAFGKIFLNSAVSKSTTYTVTSADQGQLINVTNTTTINLPASGSVGPNFVVTIRNNGSDTVTIDGNSSELINGAVTQALAPSFSMILMSDGNGWYGLAALNEGLQTALNGLTATAAELNTLDGITATTAELNILDGVTATAAELNRVDGTLLEVQNKLQIFSGYVDASAASAVLPSGWFVSKSVTGQYQITHGIGLSTPTSDLIVTANIVSNGSIVDRYCTVQNPAAVSFYVYVRDESSAALADNAFYFTAIQRA